MVRKGNNAITARDRKVFTAPRSWSALAVGILKDCGVWGRPSPFHITTNRTTPRNSVTIRRGNNSHFHNSRKRGGWRVAAPKYSVKLPTGHNRKTTILTSTTHRNAEGDPGAVPRAWAGGTLDAELQAN